MRGRGAETGGLTIRDALREYERKGYRGQIVPREGGMLECLSCHEVSEPEEIRLDSIRRVEGVSDPSEMTLIGAMECPACHALGTTTFCFGAVCTAEESEALRRLHVARPSVFASNQAELGDRTLAADSGWIDRSPWRRGPHGEDAG